MTAITLLVSFWDVKFLLLNIGALVGAFFLISSYIKSKKIRTIFVLLFSLVSVLQIASFYFTRTFISYSFIVHLNTRDVMGMKDLFIVQIFICVFLLLLFTVIYYKSRSIIEFVKTKFKLKLYVITILRVTGLTLSIILMSLKSGVLNEGYVLLKSLNVDYENFDKELASLSMQDYVKPKELIVTQANKNIIILSLESFEKGYLSDKHAALTPYLRGLKNNSNWSYLDLNQNEGSTWTSGSLYTSITGFPAYFGTEANGIFQTSYRSNITGISHILNKANHDLIYITDNADISGTNAMLYALEVNEVIDQKNVKKSIRDKDVFELAKQRLTQSKTKKQPFTLILSTVSTHFPDGKYDERMEEYLPKQSSNLEFMVSATDYLVKDFMSFLEAGDFLENTIIYIYPDHLKMGSDAIFKNTGNRGMFVLTNAPKKEIASYKNDNFYQIDLPKLILDGAEVKHNAKFLSDYIEIDKNKYIENNITQLTSLNLSGFSRAKIDPYLIPKKSKYYESYVQDTSRFIAHAGGTIDRQIYTNSLEALDSSYEKGFRLFELDIRKTNDDKYVAVHYWDEWAERTEYKGVLPPSYNDFIEHRIQSKYSPLGINDINEWFNKHTDAVLITDKVNTPKEFSNLFIDKQRLIMELFTWEAVEEAIASNIKSAMPSQRVVMDLGFNANGISRLKEKGITQVALSRYILANEIDFIKELKENNIKVYLYNIDAQEIDEDYVVKYEMDFIYGIYADDWKFE